MAESPDDVTMTFGGNATMLELVRGGPTGSDVAWRGYVSGDTLYRPYLGEVLQRCGPLDVVIPHLGGTTVLGLTVTMDGRQGADLVELLEPPLTVPVHYDDYDRFRSPRGETVSLRPLPRCGPPGR